MQSPATVTEEVTNESSTGKKYTCDECDQEIFVEHEPVARDSGALIHNHYQNKHQDLTHSGGLRGATYVGWGAPQGASEETDD